MSVSARGQQFLIEWWDGNTQEDWPFPEEVANLEAFVKFVAQWSTCMAVPMASHLVHHLYDLLDDDTLESIGQDALCWIFQECGYLPPYYEYFAIEQHEEYLIQGSDKYPGMFEVLVLNRPWYCLETQSVESGVVVYVTDTCEDAQKWAEYESHPPFGSWHEGWEFLGESENGSFYWKSRVSDLGENERDIFQVTRLEEEPKFTVGSTSLEYLLEKNQDELLQEIV